MPKIISSTTLRNNYAELSDWCHKTGKPLFVTKNGAGDLAVLDMDAYEDLTSRLALYESLAAGRVAADEGHARPAGTAAQALRRRIGPQNAKG